MNGAEGTRRTAFSNAVIHSNYAASLGLNPLTTTLEFYNFTSETTLDFTKTYAVVVTDTSNPLDTRITVRWEICSADMTVHMIKYTNPLNLSEGYDIETANVADRALRLKYNIKVDNTIRVDSNPMNTLYFANRFSGESGTDGAVAGAYAEFTPYSDNTVFFLNETIGDLTPSVAYSGGHKVNKAGSDHIGATYVTNSTVTVDGTDVAVRTRLGNNGAIALNVGIGTTVSHDLDKSPTPEYERTDETITLT